MSDSPEQLPAAHPWRRFMGICYECLMIFGVVWLGGYLFSSLTQFTGEDGPLKISFQILMVAVLAVYFTGFWQNGRRTLPMKTLSLQLIGPDGKGLSAMRSLIRYLAALLMLFAGLAAYEWIHPMAIMLITVPATWSLVDPQRRALYDIVAGSRLVTTPER